MPRKTFWSAIVGAAVLLILPCVSAHAQATRTWVSGVGDDANPCSRTAPCKTFAGAISKTAVAGEIDCLDPGGFGALTITKSISIDCEAASNGGVLVSGSNGIVVTGGAVFVNLRGLDFDGIGGGGLSGVVVNAAVKVQIENCKIYGFSTAGINITSGAQVSVFNVRLSNNAVGILLDGTAASTNVTVTASQVNFNTNNGITVQTTGMHAGGFIDRTTIFGNGGTGFALSGTNALGVIGNSSIQDNTTAGVSNSGGNLLSYKNNQIFGNGTDGTPINPVPAPTQPLQ
jgi:hypothetical protein